VVTGAVIFRSFLLLPSWVAACVSHLSPASGHLVNDLYLGVMHSASLFFSLGRQTTGSQVDPGTYEVLDTDLSSSITPQESVAAPVTITVLLEIVSGTPVKFWPY
jgi:hypothetical protein